MFPHIFKYLNNNIIIFSGFHSHVPTARYICMLHAEEHIHEYVVDYTIPILIPYYQQLEDEHVLHEYEFLTLRVWCFLGITVCLSAGST